MKDFKQSIINFVKRRYILLIVTIVSLGAIVFLGGLITYNQSRHFCYGCHIYQGQYRYINKDRPVHKDIDKHIFGCITCHKDKAVQHIYKKNIEKLTQEAQLAGNLRFTAVENPRDTYTTEECLSCHPDRLDVDERSPYLLSSHGLQKLGLRFDKRLHHEFERFDDSEKAQLDTLSAKTTLTDAEQKQLQELKKIRDGNCAQCHMRKKQIGDEVHVDKQVNFVARNPISCSGCHEDASTATHPGQPLKPPTRQTCRKCHHGKIHGRFAIFKADCDEQKDTKDCVKCHPLI
ncbi:hypothetical protein JW960_12980 [candidate division KSB1 bacterium]|nr:hypothetical protein [candidate division KSB1 bacterium]